MQQQKPNILWICTDQQRADSLGCYGNPFVHTPNVDRLAEGGVRFDRAYTQSPVCAPSRAAFLTGRYPRTCRLRQNGQDIPPTEVLLPRLLKDNGYACGLSGKLHLTACMPKTGRLMEPRIDDGYDYFAWSHHPGYDWPFNAYSMWLAENGQTFSTPRRDDCRYVHNGMAPEWHQTTWCTNEALSFIKSCEAFNKPWMFSLNYYDPHHSFDPPEAYLARYLDALDDIPLPNYTPGELDGKPVFQQTDHTGAYDTPGSFAYDDMTPRDHRMLRAAYWAMCDLVDDQVGRLLDYLEESGQLENTIVLYMSDHGEHLGDHGMYLKGPCFYENDVRVPLIISWPGHIAPQRHTGALVELIDLPQTLCDAAGIAPHPGMMGRSLWPLLRGDAPLEKHRESAYCEYYNSNVNHVKPKAYATMVCDERWKLVRYSDRSHEYAIHGELYDLQADPDETVNLYADPAFAREKTRLLELLCDRMAETCDPLPERLSFW